MPLCLIVDDSKIVRTVARRIIELLGFAVEEAAHGEEALTKCTHTMPQFILLDWHMPVMDGMEFMKRFKALPASASAKVIFCTTETDMDHIKEALAAGAHEYVMKPFNEAILKDKMAQSGLILPTS